MPFIQDFPAEPTVKTPPCIYLRNKAMYLRGSVGDPDNYPEETNVPFCWCNQTQNYLGPDNKYVTRKECVPGRECYCETYQ